MELALLVQILIWLAICGIFLASGQSSVFHPLTFYLLFHGIVFVLRPLEDYYLKFDNLWKYMRFEPTEQDLIKVLALSSVALVVFAAASLSAGWSKLKFLERPEGQLTVADWRALVIVTLLLAPLIAYSIYRGSTGAFSGEQRGGTFVMTGDSGYTVEAQFMATPLLCIWLAVTRFRWTGLVPLILYVGYRAYSGWNRWTLVLFFVALALAYCWQHRRKWPPIWILLLAIPLVMLFQALGHRRNLIMAIVKGEPISEAISEERDETANLPASESRRVKYDTQDYANFDYLAFIVATVPQKTHSYTYGTQYLQLFTEPIPRKLWPGKPAGAPIGFFSLNQYGNFTGLTYSLPGDGWMSGGWLGLIITMAFFGCLWGRFHRWFWSHNDRCLSAMIYLVAVSTTIQQFRDGSISIAKFLFWNLSPLILWMCVSWLMGPRLVPVYSTLLPRGTRLRVIENISASQRGPVASLPQAADSIHTSL